jgi:hypothetical protein
MVPQTPSPKATDVPTQVFDQFLGKLGLANVPAEVVARLRKTLVDDRAFTELALRKAVLGDDP